MKASVILSVVASAALATAQLSNIPSCALSCAISSIGSSGCSETDIKCVCQAKSFITSITTCVQGACTPAELQQTMTAAQGLCQSVGVTLTFPSSGGSSSTTSSSSSSAAVVAPTTTSSAAAAPTTSSAAVVYVSTTKSTSTVSMTTTVTTCQGAASTTYAVSPVSNSTSTYVAPPPAYTGAASQIAGSMILAVGGAVAALFL